jgi:hypothetical protein
MALGRSTWVVCFDYRRWFYRRAIGKRHCWEAYSG